LEVLAAWRALSSPHPTIEATDEGRINYHG
jgi:hypothetical protein